jgi:hypothetical protein
LEELLHGGRAYAHHNFIFEEILEKWYIFFEIFAGCMGIADAWMLNTWEFAVCD